MKRGHPSFLGKALYGLGILVILAVVLFLVGRFWSSSSYDPSWSPDGTRIAFIRDEEIWLMNPDGTNQKKISDNGLYPAWSPDGTQIAFEFCQPPTKNSGIFVVNADGTNQQKLTSDGYSPAWSPDGTKITFFSGAYNNCRICVMNADGTNQKKLTNSGGCNLTWSPDGSKIAFVVSETGWETLWKEYRSCIWVTNADGSNQRRLTR